MIKLPIFRNCSSFHSPQSLRIVATQLATSQM